MKVNSKRIPFKKWSIAGLKVHRIVTLFLTILMVSFVFRGTAVVKDMIMKMNSEAVKGTFNTHVMTIHVKPNLLLPPAIHTE